MEKRISYVAVKANFTKAALKFIDAKRAKDSSVLVRSSHRYVRGRVVGVFLPYTEAKLDVAGLSEDFVNVESNAGIPVLVAKEIYSILIREKIPLIVTTSGFWKCRKLRLKDDLSWLLCKQDTRVEANRHYVLRPDEI